MDYEALLRKYMAHVVDHEGCDYTEYNLPRDVEFTPEEWAKLQEIAGESKPTNRPTVALHSTRVFIDGEQIEPRSIAQEDSPRGVWMTIEADGLPIEGRHQLRVIFPDGLAMEWDCQVDSKQGETRFYPLDKGREMVVDKGANEA